MKTSIYIFAPYCVKSRFVTFLNLHEQKKKKIVGDLKRQKKTKKRQWASNDMEECEPGSVIGNSFREARYYPPWPYLEVLLATRMICDEYIMYGVSKPISCQIQFQ